MKAPRASEEQIQIAVAAFLDMALPDDAMWWHTPNGGQRHPAVAAKLKAQGVKAGVPDVLILWAGRLITIELKNAIGVSSADQSLIAYRMVKCGATVGPICRSVDDVYEYLICEMPLMVKRFGAGFIKVQH